MAKKDLLKSQMKRPAPLKRTQPADDDQMTEAVNRVAQDGTENGESTPAAEQPTGTPPSTAATAKEKQGNSGKASATGAKSRQGRGGASKKPAAAAPKAEAPEAEEEKEPLKRMTIDLPKSLHTRLKIDSTRRGIYMREHIIELIEKSLE
jgi:hypothetical protein